MVYHGRNHPAVVMWSIGNEIPCRGSPLGYNLSATLTQYVQELDPAAIQTGGGGGTGRAITSAYPHPDNHADPFFAPLSVAGYNYAPDQYYADHIRAPGRVMVGTESLPSAAFQMWTAVWNSE